MHYDIPKLSSLYVHRVGRTARAGKSGLSLALVSQHDVYFVHRIERKTGSRMKRLHSKSVSDEAVLGCLDEVSKAKVQAKLQVRQQFGDRAERLKELAESRRQEINQAIRADGRRSESQQQTGAPRRRRAVDQAEPATDHVEGAAKVRKPKRSHS